MIELKGKYASAKIFSDTTENSAIGQIIALCNQPFVKDSKIRIMSDVHAGEGCTIGTTMTIKDKVCPNLVGVDVGCFTLDTKVQLCDGRKLSFGEMIEEHKKGIEHYGYSIDNKGDIKISKLEYPREIKTVNKLVKIILDNDEEIFCTLDHIFYTRENEQIEAQNLHIGQSLMPLYIEKFENVKEKVYNTTKFNYNGYDVVYNPNKEYYELIHLLSDQYNEKNKLINQHEEKRFVRHHKDFCKTNNNPTNIQRVGFKEHWKIHSDNIGKLSKKGISGFKVARAKHPEFFLKWHLIT